MELIDTIDGMTSDDYKERFKAEYNQVVIRRNKLIAFLDKANNKLCFSPNSNYYLLKEQLKAMNAYIDILVLRANTEGINLD